MTQGGATASSKMRSVYNRQHVSGVQSCGNEQGSDILHVRPGAAAGRQEEAGGGVDVQGMHAPGSGPVFSAAPVVGHCMLQTPPPLTVEAPSCLQFRDGLPFGHGTPVLLPCDGELISMYGH